MPQALSCCLPGTNSMTKLLVGFDSAWTRTKIGAIGAIVAAVLRDDGTVSELGPPRPVRFDDAAGMIRDWQASHASSSTLILLDQPTIVANEIGQRPVEHIVCPCVSRRRGGMQPANRGRKDMFGPAAPVWEFLAGFGGPADPFGAAQSTRGRLPKYNPERRKTFAIADWAHVCRAASMKLAADGAPELAAWAESGATKSKPVKGDQDQLDASICLVAALHLAKRRHALFVGSCTTGYIVVPDSEVLRNELERRCAELGRESTSWVRVFRLAAAAFPSVGDT
jgi:predicted RNase H-like nuclease